MGSIFKATMGTEISVVFLPTLLYTLTQAQHGSNKLYLAETSKSYFDCVVVIEFTKRKSLYKRSTNVS